MIKLKLAEVFGWVCSICGSPGDPSTGMCTKCGIWKSCGDGTGTMIVRPPKPQKRKRK